MKYSGSNRLINPGRLRGERGVNLEGEAIKMKWQDSGGRREDSETKLWYDGDLTYPESD